jgi:glucoamylase
MVSPDALALVRFGLRAADDPRIVDTVKVVDALLRVELPGGSSWRRYNGDGYGEHEDGRPFDGTGIGRAWPLLTGERGHYELAAGRPGRAEELARAMEAFAGTGQLIPEQVWDAPSIPERELFTGHTSGSARPLVWAHAEYLKLRRSIQQGRVFDQPPQTVARYLTGAPRPAPFAFWRFNHKIRTMPAGRPLRVETLAGATIVWTADGWQEVLKTANEDAGLGIFVADLPTTSVPRGSRVEFTFHWTESTRWEGVDFVVLVE